MFQMLVREIMVEDLHQTDKKTKTYNGRDVCGNGLDKENKNETKEKHGINNGVHVNLPDELYFGI